MVFSTYLGGIDVDSGDGIAVDITGNNIYVTGSTFSLNFPIRNGYYVNNSGGYDSFVTEFTVPHVIIPITAATKQQIPSPGTNSELLQNPLVDIGIILIFLSIMANIVMAIALSRKRA